MEFKAKTEHLVVLGGGGYNPWTTIRAWVGLWGLLSGNDLPGILPDEAQAILARFDSDLIDEEDRLPEWITRLQDQENIGSVRGEIKRRIELLTGQR